MRLFGFALELRSQASDIPKDCLSSRDSWTRAPLRARTGVEIADEQGELFLLTACNRRPVDSAHEVRAVRGANPAKRLLNH
jgi:hypothetical protein